MKTSLFLISFMFLVNKALATKILVRTVYSEGCSDEESKTISDAIKGASETGNRRLYYEYVMCNYLCMGFPRGTCWLAYTQCIWYGRRSLRIAAASARELETTNDESCDEEVKKIDTALSELSLGSACATATLNPKHTCYVIPDTFSI